MCFAERDLFLCYFSVTRGPFTALDAALNPEILVLLFPLSFVRSSFSRFVVTKAFLGPHGDLHQLVPGETA